MIKINLSKEEVVTPKRFCSVRWRIELEDYADNDSLKAKIEELQEIINRHIEEQKKTIHLIDTAGVVK